MKPVEVAQRYFDAWNAHDPAAIVATFGPGGTYSDPAAGQGLTGPAIGAYAAGLFAAFPDLTYTVEDEMAERDLVLTRFAARGTNTGPFLGHKPTGRVVSYTGFDMNRIVGGKIVESWVSYDALGLLQQLGLVPPVKGI